MPERLRNTVRDFCSRVWNRQSLTFLFFLVLSCVFWIFTALNEDGKEEFAIPLELTDIPENVVITTDLPATLHFSIHDKGGMLLLYKYVRKFSPLTVDFKACTAGARSGYGSMQASDLLKQLTAQLNPGAQVSGVRPQLLEFYYNYGEKKRVPVRIAGTLRPKEMYYLSDVRYSPDSVTVYASRSILDTLTAAYTERLFQTDLTDTISLTVPLQPLPGVKYMPGEVTLSAFADRLIEKEVHVPVKQANFPASKQLRTFPSMVTVTFQVGMHLYQKVTAENFIITLSYEDLIRSNSTIAPLSLKSVPEGVRHARISPENVEFVIEDVPEGE